MKRSFFARRGFLIIMVTALLFFPIAMGAKRALLSNQNNMTDWLPAGFAETEELSKFQEHFAGEKFIICTWEGCTLGNAQKLEMLDQKMIPPDDSHLDDEDWPFKSVITGPRLLEQMTDPDGDLKLSREEAISRLRGLVIGPEKTPEGEPLELDERQTCLIVTLTDSKKYKSRDLVGRGMAGSELGPVMRAAHNLGLNIGRDPGVLFQLTQELNLAPDAIHLGGPPVDAVAIDEEGEKTLVRLVGLAALVGLGLAYWCFRSFRVTFMVFTAGVLSAMLCLAMVWWFGLFEQYALGKEVPRFGTLDAVLMSMPAVIYVLGLSGAIHLINYYRDAVAHGGPEGAADRAVGMGWGPCALAACTTAIGLASLYVSNIVPIQKFGVYSAFGVLGTLLALFLLLPSLLELGVTKRGIRLSDENIKTTLDRPGFVRAVRGFGSWILRHNVAVSVCGIAIMITCVVGLTRIGTEIQLLKLFSPGARLLADYEYLEDRIGDLIPMELLIKVDSDTTRDTYDERIGEDGRYRYTLLERLELIKRVQDRIETLRMEKDGRTIQPVGKAVSVATFADRLDEDWGDSGGFIIDNEREGRNVLNEKLKEAYENDKLPRDYWSIDYDDHEELWRVHLRVAAFEDIDYGTFGREIREVVEPVLSTYRWRDRIIEQLAAEGKTLAGARISVLGLSESNDADELKHSLPLMFASLLRRGGAKVSFSDQHFAKLPKGTPYGLAGKKASKLTAGFLGKQDLVLITGDPSVFPADKLAEYAPTEIVDVAVDPEGLSEEAQATFATSYTGAVPVVYKAQRELLNGLIKSIGLAFVTIAIVMMFKLGGVLPGLVSMIPNVFPVVIVFGLMGWLGVLVDIGAMMTASIALGVAVDDTVHFLTWFRIGLNEGKSRKDAVRLAYSRCARAMTQTTIIGGLGLAVFALSTFTPTKVFGFMMLSILTAALVGDLILLPALLVGPLGKCFKAKKQKSVEEATPEPVVAKIPAKLGVSNDTTLAPHQRRDSTHRRVDM
ncbi:MAG: MMPL family transporter [Pirellulales bacterium]|nr:MMPL family transporter [Pirellulales bacterium]